MGLKGSGAKCTVEMVLAADEFARLRLSERIICGSVVRKLLEGVGENGTVNEVA